MRPHFALDALDSYEKAPDDLTRSVPNPAKAKAKAATQKARALQGEAEKALADAVAAAADPASGARRGHRRDKQRSHSLEVARAGTEKAQQRAGAVPARVPSATSAPTLCYRTQNANASPTSSVWRPTTPSPQWPGPRPHYRG